MKLYVLGTLLNVRFLMSVLTLMTRI